MLAHYSTCILFPIYAVPLLATNRWRLKFSKKFHRALLTGLTCNLFQNREDFIDDSFPPSPKSLFYDPKDPANHQVRGVRGQLFQGTDKQKGAFFSGKVAKVGQQSCWCCSPKLLSPPQTFPCGVPLRSPAGSVPTRSTARAKSPGLCSGRRSRRTYPRVREGTEPVTRCNKLPLH